MRAFVYGAEFEPGDHRGIVVSFPDVPEAVTQGDDDIDARAMAEEALGLALLTYPEHGLPLPRPKARRRDLVPVSVAPDVAAKLAVLEAFREAGITKSELGRRINKDEKEVRRILKLEASNQTAGAYSDTARARPTPGDQHGEGGRSGLIAN
jgi:antitoxin HicB